MTTDGADRSFGAPQFDVVLRGYDRRQVDEHLSRLQRVLSRMRSDLEAARGQAAVPPPPPAYGAPRPRPTPRPRPDDERDVVGTFTERMQTILQAAEEEAAEIRARAQTTARTEQERLASALSSAQAEEKAARASLTDLLRQRDTVLADLTRVRGQLEALLSGPTARIPVPRPDATTAVAARRDAGAGQPLPGTPASPAEPVSAGADVGSARTGASRPIEAPSAAESTTVVALSGQAGPAPDTGAERAAERAQPTADGADEPTDGRTRAAQSHGAQSHGAQLHDAQLHDAQLHDARPSAGPDDAAGADPDDAAVEQTMFTAPAVRTRAADGAPDRAPVERTVAVAPVDAADDDGRAAGPGATGPGAAELGAAEPGAAEHGGARPEAEADGVSAGPEATVKVRAVGHPAPPTGAGPAPEDDSRAPRPTEPASVSRLR